MRRSLAVLLSACLTALALLAVSPSAQAATPITGRLVDVTGSGQVAGMTVQLFEPAVGAPGTPGTTMVTTGTTDATGRFSLDPTGSTASKFFVFAVADDYQEGWVDGVGGWLQKDPTFARKFAPATTLGNIKANPAFIRGIVVNSLSKKAVAGVTVTARSQDAIKEVDGADVTDAEGRFRINGLECEDNCFLRINGSARGYETGYRACNARVVATWGDACASPIGGIGRVFLDRL